MEYLSLRWTSQSTSKRGTSCCRSPVRFRKIRTSLGPGKVRAKAAFLRKKFAIFLVVTRVFLLRELWGLSGTTFTRAGALRVDGHRLELPTFTFQVNCTSLQHSLPYFFSITTSPSLHRLLSPQALNILLPLLSSQTRTSKNGFTSFTFPCHYSPRESHYCKSRLARWRRRPLSGS